MSALIAFSHIRWSFVYQRPQQLLSRMARHRPVVYIEEPVYDESGPSYEEFEPVPGLRVIRPHLPSHGAGFHDEHLPYLTERVRALALEYPECIAWFYTPMALPLIKSLAPRLVVYDCMEELAAFRHAPRQLSQRESALLKLAQVVFTGGPSLYRAKRLRHPNVHCVPSSVNVEDFRQARDASVDHPFQMQLPHPRLGYLGVLDERLDYEILATLARQRPHWQIVLVGPIANLDPALLPRAPGIHYAGLRSYAELPRFLAGWDLCLLPFLRNDATRYLSPNKLLEYMAAQKPIVSTPLADIEQPYGDAVYLGAEPDAFVAACDRALYADDAERERRFAHMREALRGTSWDETVARMEELMAAAAKATERSEAARALLEAEPEPPDHLASGVRPARTTAVETAPAQRA